MSAPTLQELLAQREELEKLIAETAKNQRSQVLEEVKAVMAKHGLTVADLVKELGTAKGKAATGAPSSAPAKSKVAVKYKDPESGNQWTGRGLQPKWLREKLTNGAKLEDFLVK